MVKLSDLDVFVSFEVALFFLKTYENGVSYEWNVSDIENSTDDTTPCSSGPFIDIVISKFQYTFNKRFM